jgi:hypothetical protein
MGEFREGYCETAKSQPASGHEFGGVETEVCGPGCSEVLIWTATRIRWARTLSEREA